VWKRHRRFSGDGTWDKILAVLLARADAVEEIDWTVSVDSTINRAHQHATNLPRDGKPSPHADDADLADGEPAGPAELDTVAGVVGLLAGDTGGWIESQEFARSPSSAGN
jgi:hypothetical protein